MIWWNMSSARKKKDGRKEDMSVQKPRTARSRARKSRKKRLSTQDKPINRSIDGPRNERRTPRGRPKERERRQ